VAHHPHLAHFSWWVSWQSHGRLIITLIMTLLVIYKPGQFKVHSSEEVIILRLRVCLNFINLFQIKRLSKVRSRQSTRDNWPSGRFFQDSLPWLYQMCYNGLNMYHPHKMQEMHTELFV
jgi:hypothetical protein